ATVIHHTRNYAKAGVYGQRLYRNLSMQSTTVVLFAAALQNPRRRQLIREGPLAPSPGGRTICQKRREFRCLREAARIPQGFGIVIQSSSERDYGTFSLPRRRSHTIFTCGIKDTIQRWFE